jgi:hypothetical protein
MTDTVIYIYIFIFIYKSIFHSVGLPSLNLDTKWGGGGGGCSRPCRCCFTLRKDRRYSDYIPEVIQSQKRHISISPIICYIYYVTYIIGLYIYMCVYMYIHTYVYVVVIATHYGLHGLGIESREGRGYPNRLDRPEAHRPRKMGAGSFQRVKQPKRGTDQPPTFFL